MGEIFLPKKIIFRGRFQIGRERFTCIGSNPEQA
jgi:hypothetical protein